MEQWQAFGVTLACEVPVMLLLARRHAPARVALGAIGINGLTHPVAWTVALLLAPDEYRLGLWVIEGCVVLAEAAWYRWWLGVGGLRALGWALLANVASLGLGWWLW